MDSGASFGRPISEGILAIAGPLNPMTGSSSCLHSSLDDRRVDEEWGARGSQTRGPAKKGASIFAKPYMGVPKILGTILGAPNDKDGSIDCWGLYWGSPYFGKLPSYIKRPWHGMFLPSTYLGQFGIPVARHSPQPLPNIVAGLVTSFTVRPASYP